MQTKIIEVTNGPRNHGKFMLARPDEEWMRKSIVDASIGTDGDPEVVAINMEGAHPLLTRCGWEHEHLWVMDLQTGEGAFFRPGPGRHASNDLNEKHSIWVCPMFEPFLNWLYQQDLASLDTLPEHVDLPDAPFAISGYRRKGGRGTDQPSEFASFSDG